MNAETFTYVTINVSQGEFRVSRRHDEMICTVLGSCVATCMWDPVNRIGGLNHFLLAEGETGGPTNSRYGLHSMELLINGLLKYGAERKLLVAKLFGGARMFDGLGAIGEDNARFARNFLAAEGIPCHSESLGGTAARKIRFWPTTGRAQQMFLPDVDQALVSAPKRVIPPKPADDDITFF
ncbi:MAG: chemotaxis protein CheD [Paracoccaceae bacterium]